MLAVVVGAGCTRTDPPTVTRDPTPPVAKSAAPAPAPIGPPVHATSGDVVGSFRPASQDVVVGEPIVVAFEVRNDHAPMKVAIGGDQRNAANFPTRVAVKVERGGEVVCDSVAKPAIMSFGGIGGDQTFAKGETMREALVLNPACPALATPGDYRVTLHRRVAHAGLTVTKPGATVPTSCDVFPIHEGPLPAAYGPDCAKLVASMPWVTTRFGLRVRPFDAGALRAAVDARLAETKHPYDGVLEHRIGAWLCGWVACACAKTGTTFDVSMLPVTTPSTLATGCPR